MADNSENILTHLQQYNMPPPAGAFSKAWECIVQQAGNAVSSSTVIPSSENMEQSIFTELQQYSMAAPPLNFAALKNKATGNSIVAKRKPGIPMPFLKAASIFLLLASGTVLYFTVFHKNNNSGNSYSQANKNIPAVPATVAAKNNDSLSTSVAAVTSAGMETKKSSAAAKAAAKKIFASSGAAKNANSSKVTFSNGGSAKLYDNDVLFTLTSYSGNGWQQFFTSDVLEKKITLNKYSYMNLSDKMVEMLQETYLTKKNGTPSRKAKKTKKKFDKWRKKDEKYFDSNMQKNPADIIDLSDLIL